MPAPSARPYMSLRRMIRSLALRSKLYYMCRYIELLSNRSRRRIISLRTLPLFCSSISVQRDPLNLTGIRILIPCPLSVNRSFWSREMFVC